MRCQHCGTVRPFADLIAFWSPSRPEARRYVCRPDLEAPHRGACFRLAVPGAATHQVELAERQPHSLERTPIHD